MKKESKSPELHFSRYKSEHVADHLRESIRLGNLREPLPSIREWCAALDVSTVTLQAALKILKQEGWIGSQPRKGIHLIRKPPRAPRHPPIVRWIWQDPRHRSLPPVSDVIVLVSQKLAAHGIGLQIERCDEKRLRAAHAAGVHPEEMLLFTNIGLTYQKLFAELKNTLILGLPLDGIRLPYISSDIFPAIRHAVYRLLMHGCDHVEVLNIVGRRVPESFLRLEEEMQEIRARAPRSFQGGVTWLPSEQTEQCRAIQRLASRFRGKQGLVVNAPLAPGFLIMVLKDRGFKIPDQVEILPVNCVPSQLAVHPPLEHYPHPSEKIAKAICKAATHYFKTGALPELYKLIPLSLECP